MAMLRCAGPAIPKAQTVHGESSRTACEQSATTEAMHSWRSDSGRVSTQRITKKSYSRCDLQNIDLILPEFSKLEQEI
jgi:hypothetical protein